MTKKFIGNDKINLKALVTQDVDINQGRPMAIERSKCEWPCDLAVLSTGFVSLEDYVAKK